MSQRVKGKEIEITVGMCWFSVNIHFNFCAASTRNGKPCPLVFSSSKVNWIFGFIEFRCL